MAIEPEARKAKRKKKLIAWADFAEERLDPKTAPMKLPLKPPSRRPQQLLDVAAINLLHLS